MRLILLTCAIGLALSPLGTSGQVPTGAAQVVGRVIDAETNTPIAGARVSVGPVFRGPRETRFWPPAPGSPGGAVNTLTDEDGRFVLDGVPLGEVSVLVHKPGFAEGRPGQSTLVNISLRRGGVLSGRVLDERGEPLPDIRVTALRRMPGRGDSLTMTGAGPGAAVTNDLGEFRIAGLAAGDYVLSGTPLPQMSISGGGAGPKTTWALTYYPGTTNQPEAQAVTLPQGETVPGLEFRLISSPAFRVTGTVVDEAGKPLANAMVSLSAPRLDRGTFVPPAIARTKPDGTFTIGGVSAGRYVVSATRMARPESGATTMIAIGAPAGGAGVQEINVDGADVTGLKVIVATRQ
jgi:hypothetical protein